MHSKLNVALILSGGSGSRFENSLPKQFAEVYGKTILEYCLTNYNKHIKIHKILIVSNPNFIDRTKQIANVNKFNKIIEVIEGGKTRGESSYLGLRYLTKLYESQPINVLIHDAVRPNTNNDIIDSVTNQLESSKAVSVVIPATDTVYIADENNKLVAIPPRETLFQAQTPQAFDLNLIFNAYESSQKVKRFKYSDDCSILKNVFPEENISLVEGNSSNLKITFNEDLETFRQLLKVKK